MKMTPETYALYETDFAKFNPKSCDVLEEVYAKFKEDIDAMAAKHGYRLAGTRQGRVVFTTKPLAPDAA